MKRLVIILLLLFCCMPAALPQARYKMRNSKFEGKPTPVPDVQEDPAQSKVDPRNLYNPSESGNDFDEFLYVKWNRDRRLNFDDFRYDKAYYKQMIPEKDTDLLHSVYPSYQSFYSILDKRMRSDSALVRDGTMLRANARLDSLYTGFVYSASVDRNLSFDKIDSPAASMLTISPAIYVVSDTMYYYNIVALFSKYESWMVVKSKDILEHEQIHFDIFELYARKLRKYWVDLLKRDHSKGDIFSLTKELAPVYDQLYRQLYDVQAEFDEQTAALTANNEPLLSLNRQWERTINTQLDSLRLYASPEGTVVSK